ncbi:YceI family protein [Yinghuangia soli]|uniref:YceI family protein n=1 Tax=Yinghuangia soli TaxID=2908204 RepID=A0AA41Q7T6_9ACTN|nr:YceI family protein [Yinghuangia soli]MCF2533185.1 YceI family protein [Yinghuangia soli]
MTTHASAAAFPISRPTAGSRARSAGRPTAVPPSTGGPTTVSPAHPTARTPILAAVPATVPPTVLGAPDANLPPAGTWYIDPAASSAAFTTADGTAGGIRGRFRRVSGLVEVSADHRDNTVWLSLAGAGVTLGTVRRLFPGPPGTRPSGPGPDGVEHDGDELDGDEIDYLDPVQDGLTHSSADEGVLVGELMLHGALNPVVMQVGWHEPGPESDVSAQGTPSAGFTAHTTVALGDFGIRPDDAAGLPGLPGLPGLLGLPILQAGDRVRITLDIALLRHDPTERLANAFLDRALHPAAGHRHRNLHGHRRAA